MGRALLHDPRHPPGRPGPARGPAGGVPRRAAGVPRQGPPGDDRRRHHRVPARARAAATAWPGRPPRSRCSRWCWPWTATTPPSSAREIRRRGPAAVRRSGAYRRPCGIARAMWRAEDAWRAELAAHDDRRPGGGAPRDSPVGPADQGRGVDPVRGDQPKEPSMKIFLAGGTGVVGTRALPALVAAGHDVTAVARTDAKAELVRSLGRRAGHRRPVRRRGGRGRRRRPRGGGQPGDEHPAADQGRRGRRPGRPTSGSGSEASNHLVDAAAADRAPTATCRSRSASRTSTAAPSGSTRTTRSTTSARSAGARDAEAAALRFAGGGRRGRGAALRPVLRPRQHATRRPSTPRCASGSTRSSATPTATRSFIHADDAGAAVVAALRRAERHLQRRRRRAAHPRGCGRGGRRGPRR